MADSLVIVESPAKAKTIGKMLGSHYKVVASNGHVRDMPKSTLGVDVENGFEPKYITLRGHGDVLEQIRKAAKTARHVYLATDPDREGEAISWHLATILKIDPASACRVTFNEITQTTVKKSIHEARPIDMDLVNAQQARRVLDRLIGYQVSEIIWKKIAKSLSAGRVQSVAARILCDREDEIEAFVPEEYWTISAGLSLPGSRSVFNVRYWGENGVKRELHSEAEARDVVDRTNDGVFSVTEVKNGEKLRHAAPPFTTSSLQQEASRKLNFTTKRTMMVAQQLYEGVELGKQGTVGLISYIRTDSVRIAEEAQDAAINVIRERYGDAYVPETKNVYRGKSNAQDAHEAIRPTDVTRTPDQVKPFTTPEQYKLYKLVYERFLASQMADSRIATMSVTLESNGCQYRATGNRTLFDGFTAVYTEGKDEVQEAEQVLPAMEEGTPCTTSRVAEGEQHFTQPPQRYTEASLVRALEEKGIGRPSTYSPTISTIIERNYAHREKKQLIPTELGRTVNDWMCDNFPDIVDIGFTAGMEESLDGVEQGNVEWTGMVADFYGPFRTSLQDAAGREPVRIPDRVSDVACDKCGAMMVYKLGKFGEFLACPNYPACKNTKSIADKIGVKCPKCGGDVVRKKSHRRKIFYGCDNYPTCDFTSWERPIGAACPQCGSFLVQRRGNNGTYVTCSDRACGYVQRGRDKEENKNE